MPHGPRTTERLDRLLVSRGLVTTQARAHALVMAGRVRSRGVRLDKPGSRVPLEIPLEVLASPRHVSRGGAKLEGALRELRVDPSGRLVLDVGASTGGFTRVLLDAGASRVIALDVGRGQLDWKLREDPRVTVIEDCNARHLTPSVLPFRPSLATVDVSFISLELVLPGIVASLEAGGEALALVKPQFEAARGQVGQGGVVRDARTHRSVLEKITGFARRRGWGIRGLARSAVKGAKGNVEFFLHIDPAGCGLDPRATGEAIRAATDPPRGDSG